MSGVPRTRGLHLRSTTGANTDQTRIQSACPPKTLLIACGNKMRGDDGAAHTVLGLIPPSGDHMTRAVQQLTPELAPEIAPFSRVVFIDADAESKDLRIEPLRAGTPRSTLTHAATPEEVVALAGALFGFAGQAFLCRVPARHFGPGGAPAPEVLRFIRKAASEIAELI